MTTRRPRNRQRGYILIWLAAMMVVLLAFAGFAVDLGYWYLEGRNTQQVADSAALAGVVFREGDSSNNGEVETAARANAAENGFVDGENKTTVTPAFVDPEGNPLPLNQLRVEVERKAPSFFTKLFGFDGADLTRDAIAEYEPAPPLGSPSNVLGNEGLWDDEDSWQDHLDGGLEQSFWLDIHGPRTETAHGDQFQTDNCDHVTLGQGTYGAGGSHTNLTFEPEACDGGPTNPSYVSGDSGGLPGQDGYTYIIEAEGTDGSALQDGDTIDVELFDPAFFIQGSDCRNPAISNPATAEAIEASIAGGGSASDVVINAAAGSALVDVVNDLKFLQDTEYPYSHETVNLGIFGIWVQNRVIPALNGGMREIAQAMIELYDNAPSDPPNTNFSINTHRIYNMYAALQNYGVTRGDLEQLYRDAEPGPQNPKCTGDVDLGAAVSNPCLPIPPGAEFLCTILIIAGLFTPGGPGGPGGIGGGSLSDDVDIAPLPDARPDDRGTVRAPEEFPDPSTPSPAIPFTNDTALARSAGAVQSATPIRPAAENFAGHDGAPETTFTLNDANGTPRDPSDDPETPLCQETYGAYLVLQPPLGGGLSGYFWNWLLDNRGGTVGNIPLLPLGSLLGPIRYGNDLTSPLWDDAGGLNYYDHGFRDTARKWVNHCTVEVGPNPGQVPIRGGKVTLVLNARTNARYSGPTTNGACTASGTSCGKGANRFSIRARRTGSGEGVQVFADRRLTIFGNFVDTVGDFYLSELGPNPSRDRILTVTLHDPGDILVCADVDPEDGVPDAVNTEDCSPIGYDGPNAGVPNTDAGELQIIDPQGNPFPACEMFRVSDGAQVDTGDGSCTINTLDYLFNGDLLEVKITIPAGTFSCDDTQPEETACWIKARFDYGDPGPGRTIVPEDVTSWSTRLEGVPVRLVE